MESLYFDQDMTEVDRHSVFGGVSVVSLRRSPAKETPNEDAAAVIPIDDSSGVLVVADGLGGLRSGDAASRLAVETICETLKSAAGDNQFPLRVAIVNGMESANRRIIDLGVGAATTMAVLEVHGRSVRPYHVGDSMILVTGGRGKVKLQTVSHSPVGFAVEAGVLDEDEAMHHEDRHLVSNVVGKANMRIEMGSQLDLAARDTVVLASDGLFDNLTIDEIIARVRKGPLDRAVRALADDARRRMTCPQAGLPSKPDDATIIAYRWRPA